MEGRFDWRGGAQPPQGECVAGVLSAMRALCQSDAVLVVRVDPRRRATIAVVGLLLRCLEKALEDAEAQVVAVLAGWGEDTLSASALEGGTDEGEMGKRGG